MAYDIVAVVSINLSCILRTQWYNGTHSVFDIEYSQSPIRPVYCVSYMRCTDTFSYQSRPSIFLETRTTDLHDECKMLNGLARRS